MIWTEGDADMTFALSFPPRGEPTATTKAYRIDPLFKIPLGVGTLLVFSPHDDLYFCHEAWFEDGASGHRLAFVFRW